MTLENVYILLESSSYEDLIKELNKELSSDQRNPMLYYYRFLAYNQDYRNMDFDDLEDEVDLNKAFDLEDEYSYEAEYNFFKALASDKREVFLNALRGREKEISSSIAHLSNPNSFLTKKNLRLLNSYLINLSKPKELRLTKDALKGVLDSMRGLDNEDLKLFEEFNVLVKFLENKLELFNESKLLIKNGLLYGVAPNTLKSITIPSEVKVIGEGVFKDFKALEEIIIPEGVEEVFEYAFSGCSALKRVVLPKSIKRVHYPIFYGCSSLEELTLPLLMLYDGQYRYNLGHYFGIESYTGSIGISQLLNSGGKKTNQIYYIPASLEKITLLADTLGNDTVQWNTFLNCKMIKSINLPSNLKKIGSNAFSGCASLTSLNIPSSVTTIEQNAFKGCSSLRKIVIPDGIKAIDFPLFSGCAMLKELSMPAQCFYDGKYKYNLGLFFGPEKYTNAVYTLQTVRRNGKDIQEGYYIPPYLKILHITHGRPSTAKLCKSVLEELHSIEEITLPDNIFEIDSYVFRNCIHLSRINIPESVTTIRGYAFLGCSALESIVLPSSLSNVEANAFTNKAKIFVKKKKPMFGLPTGFNENWCPKGANVYWDYK